MLGWKLTAGPFYVIILRTLRKANPMTDNLVIHLCLKAEELNYYQDQSVSDNLLEPNNFGTLVQMT